MPPLVIDLAAADDSRDVVHRAVQALAEGKLVGLPTETVYGLAALATDAAAVDRLLAAKNRPARQPLALAVKSADDALDYAPNLSPLGRRLARRCWPGPLTLVVPDRHPESLLTRLPGSVRAAVLHEDAIGLRVPAHAAVIDIMKMLAGPLVLTSANRSGAADAVTAEQVVTALGDTVQLVINDGPAQLGQPSTVVRVHDNQFSVLRQGVMPEQTLRRLSALMVLLVCTGNTCRSPMAEAICRKLLAERLGCGVEQLTERGVIVASAGLAAMGGSRASPEAVTVLAQCGLPLDQHESQPVTEQLVRQADHIWTMTRAHRQMLIAEWPEAAARTETLSRDQIDIADPIGGPVEYYRKCAEQIQAELAVRVAELEL